MTGTAVETMVPGISKSDTDNEMKCDCDKENTNDNEKCHHQLDPTTKDIKIHDADGFYFGGIDCGCDSGVIASSDVSSPQAVCIDANLVANRNTPSIICFNKGVRLIGEEAEGRFSSCPKWSVRTLPLWLFVNNNEDIERINNRFHSKVSVHLKLIDSMTVSGPINTVVFDINFNENIIQVPIEVLLGYYIRQLCLFASNSRQHMIRNEDKKTLKATKKTPLNNQGYCLPPRTMTISLPDNTNTPEIFKAYYSAMVAGVECEFLHSSDAILNCWCCKNLSDIYWRLHSTSSPESITSEDTEEDNENCLYLCIIDMGFSETCFQLVQINAKSDKKDTNESKLVNEQDVDVEVIHRSYDPNLGTVDPLNVLFDLSVKRIKEKHGEDIISQSKKMNRLLVTCGKAMKDLSGLPDTTIFLEAFLENEEDFHYHVTREMFEKACAKIIEKICELFDKCLECLNERKPKNSDKQKRTNELQKRFIGVEVVGGGSRIPFVVSSLESHLASFFENKNDDENLNKDNKSLIRRTLDGTSSAAIGCAYFSSGKRYVKSLSQKLLNGKVIDLNSSYLRYLWKLDKCLCDVEKEEDQCMDEKNKLESFVLEMQNVINTKENSSYFDDEKKSQLESYLYKVDTWIADVSDISCLSTEDDEMNDSNVVDENSNEASNNDSDDEESDNNNMNLDNTNEMYNEEIKQFTNAFTHEKEKKKKERQKYEKKYQHVSKYVNERCADYFQKVENEKKQKEIEIENAARLNPHKTTDDSRDLHLPASQAIKKAKKNKDEGNELFNDGNVEMAVQRYLKSLQFVKSIEKTNPEKEEAIALEISSQLNIAQCYLKIQSNINTTNDSNNHGETFLNKAIKACDAVLELQPENVKALYRRAIAYERMKDYEKALADVTSVLSISQDPDTVKMKERLDKQIRVQKEKQKKMYAKMFS